MQSRQTSAGFVLACAALLIRCGSGDDSPPVPAQRCEEFLQIWCDKIAQCAAPSDRARALEDCRFVVDLDIHCELVKNIGATYSDCINDIRASQCLATGGIEFPGMCTGILIR